MHSAAPETSPRSNRHRVRLALQQQILSGELSAGDRLRQADLAKQFSVAQTVVRESLLELQFSGLVTAVDNLGVFVNELDPRTLLSAYEIREMFEGLAARLCCEQASRRDVRELRDIAGRCHRCANEGKLIEMGRLDRELHQRTIHISGNPLLERLTEGYRVLGMFVRAQRNIDQVRDEHLAIIDTIHEGDADAAERLARDHVRKAREALQKRVDEGAFEPALVVEDKAEKD